MNTATQRESNDNLTGMNAIVTGAAQGLGLAVAQELAQRGANVLIADVQLDKAQAAADSLLEQGLSASAHQVDIAQSASVDRLIDDTAKGTGRLDILVNNAGVGQNVSAISELSDVEWNRVINITLTGTFHCCRAAARVMERQESGCIVNIASINGQNPAALVAAYNVAKAGVISLTKTLAMELAAYGVRVNAVSPGPVYTDFNRRVMAQRCKSLNLTEDQMIERIRGSIPLGRWGEATDIANMVAFLCTARASWITGEVLRVSGGLEGVAAAPPKRQPTANP